MNSLEIIIIIKKKTENVIFAEAVRPPILEIFWQKQRTSGNNCIKQKAMVVGQKSSKSLGVILYVLPLLIWDMLEPLSAFW